MSLSYELKLKLKEAGFPNSKEWFEQKTVCKECGAPYENKKCDCGWYGGYTYTFEPETSLSELIYACANDTFLLYKSSGEWVATKKHIVGVNDDGTITDLKLGGKGNSPEEAVANLYLAINKK